ncbi:RNA polymerase sigma-70 factor [Actinorugispora endophytica]|uniref:RNA polymerase ECF family sigma subunit n=1 Tax=Actinorugispora endophytica TaxID=1605990 RepID=A0A4R6V032_9ACTN|nr:RNA polymerase sigma-70 factor [Actinorugispora endophytica]TDQ53094.1 RNA polymerase ECF family sigma subunit [Actinorugispora endophytica]
MSATEEFEAQRPRLLALAYRLLGSASEAEDAVQDAFLRWNAADRALIGTPAAWLAKVLTNLCLNRLDSARARRERYVGSWLPEPVLTADPAPGPLETAELRESVSMAFLVLLERLTPPERAVFVLREAFGYGHREIADILDVTESASQQLHHRARLRLGRDRPRFEASAPERRRVVERFLAAAADGDMAGLERLLAADVVSWTDGGGKVRRAARRPVTGAAKVARLFVIGVLGGLPEGAEIRIVEVNGQPALVGLLGGRPFGVVLPEVADGLVTAVRVVANPDKLEYLAGQLAASGA